MVERWLPAKYRRIVYTILAALMAVEGVLNVVPDGTETRILAILGALGFTVAQSRTTDAKDDTDD